MMDRSSGCGPCPWSFSGKVGAYGISHLLSKGCVIQSTCIITSFHYLQRKTSKHTAVCIVLAMLRQIAPHSCAI